MITVSIETPRRWRRKHVRTVGVYAPIIKGRLGTGFDVEDPAAPMLHIYDDRELVMSVVLLQKWISTNSVLQVEAVETRVQHY